jgi:hypothetical protein
LARETLINGHPGHDRHGFRKAQSGTKVSYVPGNHDELFRDYPDFHFSGLEVKRETLHGTADGRRFLVLHGDEFDAVVMNNKWLETWGNHVTCIHPGLFRNFPRGFSGLVQWSRGVDVDLLQPLEERLMRDLPQPIHLYLGRLAVEKNIGDFLGLDVPGSKVVIGDGPARAALNKPAADLVWEPVNL